MNKQELIKKYKELENGTFDIGALVACQSILKDLEQLDEPQKPVVPQFVADWIEYLKKCSGTLYGSTAPYSYYGRAITDDFEGDVKKALEWIRNNSEVYARAWLDGYEVDKEKRYRVRMKGLSECYNYLNYDSIDDEWYFTDAENGSAVGTHHTRKQLEEAGFGWVFDCEGVEVEEVTE
jgi:hypothetical protein